MLIPYEKFTKHQNSYEIPNVAHFGVQNTFRQDMARFTLVCEKKSFLGNWKVFSEKPFLDRNEIFFFNFWQNYFKTPKKFRLAICLSFFR